MKLIYVLITSLLVTFSACSNKTRQAELQTPVVNTGQTPTPVVSQELTGFFLKNTYKQDEDVKLLLFNNETAFNEIFGIGKTMNNQITKPDFATSIVGAVTLKPTQKQTTITVEKMETIGDACHLFINIETGAGQTYTSTPVYIFAIEKDIPAKQFQLYVNGEKKSAVTIQ